MTLDESTILDRRQALFNVLDINAWGGVHGQAWLYMEGGLDAFSIR